MQTFDVVLKLLLQQSNQMLSQLAGVVMLSWLPTELPRVQNRRLDLLGRATNGRLVHLECQSTNDSLMPLRMAEYSLAVYRLYGEFPLQFVLYIGREPMHMAVSLPEPFESFCYTLIDVREIEGAPLLASAETSDNVLSILTRLSDQRRAVEQIVSKIAAEPTPEQRGFYLEALLILAGLRGLARQVEEEVKKVPVFIDILENEVLGREYRRGQQEGLKEGLQKGERTLLQLQMEKRFGAMPEWASQRLDQLTEPELRDLGLRLLEAQSLEELLP